MPQHVETVSGTEQRARTREEAEALIHRFDATHEAIMRGRAFSGAEDSVEALRKLCKERVEQLTRGLKEKDTSE